MNNLYWIGIRKSDLLSIETLYKGSVTFFGDGKDGNISLFKKNTVRRNHNQDLAEFKTFYIDSIKQICKLDSKAKFMFYNPQMAFYLEDSLKKRTLCLNDPNFLRLLDDKMLCKLWLKNTTPLLENVQMLGSEISLENLQKIFCDKKQFVVQSCFSSGGYGTYLLNPETEAFISTELDALQLYSISPYYRSAIPVNIHCVIYKEKIQLYPVSIQIIKEEPYNLIYRGCDFISSSSLSSDIHDRIKFYSNKICEKMRLCGYLGVCGIDFMIIEGEIYFSEINTRFQSSTFVLNLGLTQKGLPSINQATLDAFVKEISYAHLVTDIDCNIPYSSFTYIEENGSTKFNYYIYKKYFSVQPEFSLLKDGYTCTESAETNAYLFRTVYSHPLVGIYNNELRLNELLTGYSIIEPHNNIQVKTMLITFGVTISPEALSYILKKGNLRDANFSALDIIIGSIVINAPYCINNSQYSPFTIILEKNSLFLFFFNKMISEIDVYYESKLNLKQTSKGVFYSSVVFLATDRLRINYNPICCYKRTGNGCIFCNLPSTNQFYSFNDIKEIVDDYLENEEFRHILIGGGSNMPDSNFKNILNLVEFLKEKTSKPLYLMSVPPDNLNVIKELYDLGVNEIAFNIEVFDDELATQYMPGKAHISRKQYLHALEFAVQLWGKNGDVRSMLILGLEPEESFLEGIRTLCKIGVQPMISIFRPMPNTQLKNWLPFSIKKMLEIYVKAKKICDYYGQILGPSCIACQNNTLSLPDDIINFQHR